MRRLDVSDTFMAVGYGLSAGLILYFFSDAPTWAVVAMVIIISNSVIVARSSK